MRIISLNTWGGRAMHPLMRFFKEHGPTTDIFCLQEMHDTTQVYRESRHPDEWVRWDLLEKTRLMLPDHEAYFAAWKDNPDRMSVATFVRRDTAVVNFHDPVIHVPAETREFGSAVISPRKALWVAVRRHGSRRALTVMNYHGLWNGDGKEDNPERVEQSRKLAEIMGHIKGPKVLCGDFNFTPDTESFRIIRSAFDSEMVTDLGWGGTRNPLYRNFQKPGADMYADFVFTGGISLKNFKVLQDLVSDHAPMLVDLDW